MRLFVEERVGKHFDMVYPEPIGIDTTPMRDLLAVLALPDRLLPLLERASAGKETRTEASGERVEVCLTLEEPLSLLSPAPQLHELLVTRVEDGLRIAGYDEDDQLRARVTWSPVVEGKPGERFESRYEIWDSVGELRVWTEVALEFLDPEESGLFLSPVAKVMERLQAEGWDLAWF